MYARLRSVQGNQSTYTWTGYRAGPFLNLAVAERRHSATKPPDNPPFCLCGSLLTLSHNKIVESTI